MMPPRPPTRQSHHPSCALIGRNSSLGAGTPGGVGAARKPPVFMDKGDVIEVEVKPIGTLTNPVVNDVQA